MNTAAQERTEAPLVSVIVPVYNTAPWLRRCLDSICAQSYRNLEILCVNDGSTDNSAEILAEYAAKDARIRVIHQENAGLSAARNTALEYASGEWVAGVDSDDYIAPDIVEKAVSGIAEEVDMVAFGVKVKWEDSPEKDAEFESYAADEVRPMTVEQAGSMLVCFWNKLWRRSLIIEHSIRFPHGLVHEDDGFYYQFIPYVRRVALCSAVGYYYMQRCGSITKSGQGELETTKRYTKVMCFVFGMYYQRGLCPEKSPWYQLFVSRVYADRYHVHQESERATLADLFHGMLVEQGLLPALRGDYRFRRMIPVRGWRRLFLSRYLDTELFRFFGVPVWKVVYDGERVAAHQFVLWSLAGRKLKSLLRLS